MSSPMRRAVALAFASALALPLLAAAEGYTITLKNGNTFRTRYQPQTASWDAGKILFRTDAGNWVSMASADVTSVASDSENRGFGKVINNTTLMLGAAPNDLPVPPEPGTPAAAAAAAAAAVAAAQGQQAAPYSINQFVEPGQTQGIPGGWIGNSGGYSSGPPPTATPPPAATPPPGANQ